MNSSSDVLIIGGGAIGLATAIELASRGVQVTVLSRNFREAALHAAAGMLAPQAEGLVPGPMLDLCLRSRALYPDWTSHLTALTGLETGYWPCGILAPCFTVPASREGAGQEWCDRTTVLQYQPDLSPEVLGGWWFPQDAQVNNQKLAQVLLKAVQQLGVSLEEGVTVTALDKDSQEERIQQVQTNVGPWQAQAYVLATGAWSQQLLPVPVVPRKGQLFSVQTPTQPLQRVLFGPNSYIVPRQNGRIVVGATSENVGFAAYNTPTGMQSLLAAAIWVYPPLGNFPLEDFWWGYRPATPDEWPILGASPYQNLILATGHYRNGILLAPMTARLISDLIVLGQVDACLANFSWQRFAQTQPLPSPEDVPISTRS